MNKLDEDLDDSSLFCKTLTQKRKATWNPNSKNVKQLKLQFSNKTNEVKKNGVVKGDNCEQNKTESTTGSKLDESKSSYFSVRKSLNTCPLCLKSFKSDSAYSVHMKQCAKTHKMTTQQLLGALELQKKQMQERRAFGLCSQKASSPPRTAPKKKKEKDVEEYDLALGLALSKSLSSTETNNAAVSDVQKPISSQTLEEFGFVTRNAAVGQSRRKYDSDRKSVLKERTAEERQRIIVEKVAVILLDENKEPEEKNCNTIQNGEIPQLWNMGENNGKHGWYVNGIKPLLLPEGENMDESIQSTNSDNIEKEISELNLPQKDIHKDWTKMINNRKLSDLSAKTKDSKDVYLHSLVLFARWPQTLEKDCESVFRKYNLSTVLIYLEFVYCGTLNSLVRTEINELYHLAAEFNYDELIKVLNRLRNNLSAGGCNPISNSGNVENEPKQPETNGIESKKAEVLEDRDLFTEDDVIDLTQNDGGNEENLSENESNSEKSYWSFLKCEKNRERMVEKEISEEADNQKCEQEESKNTNEVKLGRNLSNDSATQLDDELKKCDKMNGDCIILSSGSESKTQENLEKSPKVPSPINLDYEAPHFDPYDNFHFFAEEPISPVGSHSQSLLMGDVSMESLKSSEARLENGGRLDCLPEEEPKKVVGYCSTPVTAHHVPKIKRTNSVEKSRKKKMRDLSASRIIRKSLGLQHKTKPSKKINYKRTERDFAQVLTNSILHELSKSSVFQSSPPSRTKMFVEMTPISSRDEFVDNVTPSPNYSNMGESLLKEQLTKYGLKRNLAKSKAKKILRYIYEELHPLYNTETGKIVKKLPNSTPKTVKKSKAKPKPKQNDAAGKKKTGKKQKNQSNSSKESEMSGGSALDIDRLTDYDSNDSEFENLSETLTQSTPCNPVDLSSAFPDFLEMNPDFHEKILLYEPIWLEELQKKLKEAFKKHFKIADLMDFLDQKCITFRSEAQARSVQRRNEKKKGNLKKRRNNSS